MAVAYALILAHLFGDYVLQTETIARWKARSVSGVLFHGAIITLTAFIALGLVQAGLWPVAIVIGIVHTSIDTVRTRLTPRYTTTRAELVLFLGDQILHVATIAALLWYTGQMPLHAVSTALSALGEPRWQAVLIGYCLLTMPTWVLVRFTVRGLWGPQAAPPLAEGDKYGPMLERLLITTSILIGQPLWVPLIVAMRAMIVYSQRSRNGLGLEEPAGYWVETMMGMVLAIAVGTVLREYAGI